MLLIEEPDRRFFSSDSMFEVPLVAELYELYRHTCNKLNSVVSLTYRNNY